MELPNDLSAHDLERIAELKKVYGFEVIKAGVVIKSPDVPGVDMCYWRNKRGVRVSPLFPTPEAAWRDALRTHEAAVDAVVANPGVRRIKPAPYGVGAELSRLKNVLKKAGYSFGSREWRHHGMTVAGHESHEDTIRNAVKHWARRDPDAFVAAMSRASSGVVIAATNSIDKADPSTGSPGAPLTTEELTRLENLDGFQSMPESLQKMTIESQILLKSMVRSGLKIDTSAMGSDGNSILHITDGQITGVQYIRDDALVFKSRGKSFAEVLENQRKAKRAYGLPVGCEDEGKLRTLECAGYVFKFSSTLGWECEQVPYVTGALADCIKEAWQHAVNAGGDEEGMLATAKAYMEGPNEWQGIGQPPVGTTL